MNHQGYRRKTKMKVEIFISDKIESKKLFKDTIKNILY